MTDAVQKDRSGWFVVLGLLLVMAVCHGIITSALPTLDKALLAELGISRADLKLRESIFLLASGCSGLAIGFLTQYLQPRTIVLSGLALLSATLAAYGKATTIGQIYGLYVLLGMCYASSHVVIVVLMVRHCLAARQALAIAVALSGTSLGSAIFPNLTVAVLQEFDWRFVLLMLAILPIAILPVAAALLPRRMVVAAQAGITDAAGTLKSRPSISAVVLLLAAIFGIFFSSTAILLNLFLHLQDIGLSQAAAAGGLSAVFFVGLVGKVLVGAAAERWGVYPVWTSQQLILLCGAGLLAAAQPRLAIPGLLLLGLGWAGCYVLTQVVIAEVFGGANLGKVAGGFIVFEAISSGSGVWTAAALFDAYGSYRFAFELCCALLTMAIVATWLFRRQSAGLASLAQSA
ncbi:cyanate permease [Novosphingobium kunmingense]|uniref:Cyanate permease n=1 Tax=Novosphingobium kunmingense TaxID=1211806 RepID=A0A2N0H6K2_9SPHN|nr:MFS transporter [Novosphingobium kunmingense]PKB14574.1 cyanate permease [Novosphingobium kunmingense]